MRRIAPGAALDPGTPSSGTVASVLLSVRCDHERRVPAGGDPVVPPGPRKPLLCEGLRREPLPGKVVRTQRVPEGPWGPRPGARRTGDAGQVAGTRRPRRKHYHGI